MPLGCLCKAHRLKHIGCRKNSVPRKIYSCKYLHLKRRRAQINNLIVHIEILEKEEKTKPKAYRKKEIIKTRTDINKTDNRKTIVNETKSWFFERKTK